MLHWCGPHKLSPRDSWPTGHASPPASSLASCAASPQRRAKECHRNPRRHHAADRELGGTMFQHRIAQNDLPNFKAERAVTQKSLLACSSAPGQERDPRPSIACFNVDPRPPIGQPFQAKRPRVATGLYARPVCNQALMIGVRIKSSLEGGRADPARCFEPAGY
jgi:hypothetical protein